MGCPGRAMHGDTYASSCLMTLLPKGHVPQPSSCPASSLCSRDQKGSRARGLLAPAPSITRSHQSEAALPCPCWGATEEGGAAVQGPAMASHLCVSLALPWRALAGLRSSAGPVLVRECWGDSLP